LFSNGIGFPETLAILGRSNGGFLVGAALVQRPELFRAVYCKVPLLDMVRYPNFQVAKYWVPEYGDPDEAEEYQWLYAYSPYHNVRDGVKYPAVFLKTTEGDSRVDPMHAMKMAARLQAATNGLMDEAPIILTVDSREGHGLSRPVEKMVQKMSKSIVFLAHHTGLSLKMHDQLAMPASPLSRDGFTIRTTHRRRGPLRDDIMVRALQTECP